MALTDIAEAVANGQEEYSHHSARFLSGLVGRFVQSRRKRITFHVGRQCTKCGVCALVCPVQNIQLACGANGQLAPIRSDKCEACLACVHWCPAKAISTQPLLHSRYHNPQVSPDELNRLPV